MFSWCDVENRPQLEGPTSVAPALNGPPFVVRFQLQSRQLVRVHCGFNQGVVEWIRQQSRKEFDAAAKEWLIGVECYEPFLSGLKSCRAGVRVDVQAELPPIALDVARKGVGTQRLCHAPLHQLMLRHDVKRAGSKVKEPLLSVTDAEALMRARLPAAIQEKLKPFQWEVLPHTAMLLT